jgi:putative endonuclease
LACRPELVSGSLNKKTTPQTQKTFTINSMKNYYTYILTNKNNTTLYIGVTSNLEKRLYEHKNGLIDGFTKKYNCHKLVYFEHAIDVHSAISREKQLKNWHREWKLNLIRESNPDFRDLSLDWD